jgi:hypothetical protein
MTTKNKAAQPKSDTAGSIDVTVFVHRGKVREGDILKTALLAARDQIPMAAMKVRPKVVSASEVRTDATGAEGRDYVVTISWEPRRTGVLSPDDKPEPTVDDVIESLEPLTVEKLAVATDSGHGQLA